MIEHICNEIGITPEQLIIQSLQQENQQLKEALDEIREVLNNQIDYREFVDVVNAIEEIFKR